MRNGTWICTMTIAMAALVGCGTTEYVVSTKSGQMIVTSGKPTLDEKTNSYMYKDSEGRKGAIARGDVVQIIER